MDSDPSLQGQAPSQTDAPRYGSGLLSAEPAGATPYSSSSSSSSSPSSSLPSPAAAASAAPDAALELERLRAERDALAAELQIERAERLRAEERLRLLEREKLEQMREGAASREKLASELEEARLRAMRSEARQAALDADLRLSEIAARRRGGWVSPDAEAETAGNEVAEPDVEAPAPDRAQAPATAKPRRAGHGIPLPGSFSTYSRQAGQSAATGRQSASNPAPPGGAGDDAGDGGAEQPWPLPRPNPAATPAPRDERRPASRTADPPRSGSFGGFGSGDRGGSAGAKGGATAGARGGVPAPAGAKGGAAAGRPTIDRTQLEARLAAGQAVETTDRFRQFQPVAQAHIKICDWLAQARTLDEIEALAAGEIARGEILSVLTLFFERSFLVFKQ